MSLQLTLIDFGRAFATRGRAEELREDVLGRAAGHHDLTIDFAGISNVSYSFADELVGKLMAESDLDVSIVNMTPSVARSVGRAVQRRTGGAVSC